MNLGREIARRLEATSALLVEHVLVEEEGEQRPTAGRLATALK